MRTLRCLACAGICACGVPVPSAWASPPGSSVEEDRAPVEPPVLLAQVPLDYPTQATSGDHGDVSVLVDVNIDGKVIDARIESGPEVFHAAALDAARRLAFTPAHREGVPVVVTTRVRFHFAPPVEDDAEEEIVVHAPDPDLRSIRPRVTLDQDALDAHAGDDLADTVGEVPGVRVGRGTSDASKPIIRGQNERRLLVLNDGVRHESQKWGSDHGTEIDPFSAGSIAVVRGASGARHGPDAIGGVILVEPPPLRTEAGVGGRMLLGYASNGTRPHGAARVDWVPDGLPGLTLRVEGSASAGSNLTTPDYVLGNTASRTWNIGAAAGLRTSWGQVRLTWHHHDFAAGVFYGVKHGTPAEFLAQLEADVPPTAQLWKPSWTLDRAYQTVSHDIGTARVAAAGPWGQLEGVYAFQLDRRLEYDQVREGITGPQYDFLLRTHSLDVHYRHPTVWLGAARVEGGLGLQGVFQENVYRGYALLPNYRALSGGAFAWERASWGRVDVEGAARVDGLTQVAFMDDDQFERHVRRGSLDETVCSVSAAAARCPGAWKTGSVSLGALVHVVPEHLDVKLDLSTASRFPDADELYLVGTAPSFPVFAVGRPDLGTETAYGGSLTVGFRHPFLEAGVSGFANRVDDFITFSPELGTDGAPGYEVTIQGTWPRYAYQAVDAVLSGVDGSVSIAPEGPVGLDVRGSLVRARERGRHENLVGTPPDQVHAALVSRLGALGPLSDLEARVGLELVARQSRVDPAADFAPPPSAYCLPTATVRTSLGTDRRIRLGLEARNLLNARYREYTSLLRYYADQPGRDIRVRIGMDL